MPRLLLTSWACLVLLGMAGLLAYGTRPGDVGHAPSVWPGDAGLSRTTTNHELLVFAHALCPCTRATLSELERLLADVTRLPRCRVVLWSDPGQAERFARSPLRERARRMQGVDVVEDPDGAITRGFGARTSGTAYLYDPAGRLLFVGGLTPARGHEGSSRGGAALRAWLGGAVQAPADAPVFGCPILDEPTS